jgi:hypothetical protein
MSHQIHQQTSESRGSDMSARFFAEVTVRYLPGRWSIAVPTCATGLAACGSAPDSPRAPSRAETFVKAVRQSSCFAATEGAVFVRDGHVPLHLCFPSGSLRHLSARLHSSLVDPMRPKRCAAVATICVLRVGPAPAAVVGSDGPDKSARRAAPREGAVPRPHRNPWVWTWQSRNRARLRVGLSRLRRSLHPTRYRRRGSHPSQSGCAP